MTTYLCLAPLPRGGLCSRSVNDPRDHCWQHGGRWMHWIAREFMAGRSIASLEAEMVASGLTPDAAEEYVRSMIRDAMRVRT